MYCDFLNSRNSLSAYLAWWFQLSHGMTSVGRRNPFTPTCQSYAQTVSCLCCTFSHPWTVKENWHKINYKLWDPKISGRNMHELFLKHLAPPLVRGRVVVSLGEVLWWMLKPVIKLFFQKEILANVNYWKKRLQINRALAVFWSQRPSFLFNLGYLQNFLVLKLGEWLQKAFFPLWHSYWRRKLLNSLCLKAN